MAAHIPSGQQFQVGGNQFGVIELKITAPITGLGEMTPVKLKEGKLAITLTGDGCIDGNSPEGKSTMMLKFTLYGSGEGFDLKGDVNVKETRTVTPLPKDR